MPLSKTSLSFRAYDFDAKLDGAELLEACNGAILPPPSTLNEEPLVGWVGPRHLFDTEINEANCKSGKFIHLMLTKMEKKVPTSLLKTYCAMEELKKMEETNLSVLSRADKTEIKEYVRKQLLRMVPPTLSGIDIAVDPEQRRLYTDGLSESAADRLIENFAAVAHTHLRPLSPEVAAERLFSVQTEDLAPVSFSPEASGDFVANSPGLDFLMWLFYRYQTTGATFSLQPGAAPVKVSMDGPVTLILEGQGAHRILLRDGAPLNCAEFKEALLAGKKIASIRLLFEQGDDAYRCSIDGLSFEFRSVKLPPVDANRNQGVLFSEYMQRIQNFTRTFYDLYGIFLAERTDAAAWKKFVEAFQAWLPGFHVEK